MRLLVRGTALASAAVAAGALGAAIAPAQGGGPSGPPKGSEKQQTHPRVRPRNVTRHTRVRLYFTLADAPGHQGVYATEYRIQVDPRSGARAACRPEPPPNVEQGEQGRRIRVQLPTPRHGWCRGRYRVTVFLQRGPYCPEPQPGEPPQPCPLFATQDLDVGEAHFTVRRPGARR
jgi:hypothetical protein